MHKLHVHFAEQEEALSDAVSGLTFAVPSGSTHTAAHGCCTLRCMRGLAHEERCVYTRENGTRCKQPRLEDSSWCEFHVHNAVAPLLRADPVAATNWDPDAALREEGLRTQLMIRWLEFQIGMRDEADLLKSTTTEEREGGPGGGFTSTKVEDIPSPLLVLLQKERTHLAQVTRFALQSGVEERQLQLSERLAGTIIAAMQQFALGIGADPADPRVRHAMSAALVTARELTAGQNPAQHDVTAAAAGQAGAQAGATGTDDWVPAQG